MIFDILKKTFVGISNMHGKKKQLYLPNANLILTYLFQTVITFEECYSNNIGGDN